MNITHNRKDGNRMQVVINLPQEATDKLFEVLRAKQSGQTAEELAAELLEDAIYSAGIQYVDGYRA